MRKTHVTMPSAKLPVEGPPAHEWNKRGDRQTVDFNFTDDQKLFADSVRRWADDKLAPGALARAHDPHFPFDVAQMAAEQGLLGITIPEADGGQGGTLMDAVIAIEQVAAACPRSADVIQAGNFGPIRTFAEYAIDTARACQTPWYQDAGDPQRIDGGVVAEGEML